MVRYPLKTTSWFLEKSRQNGLRIIEQLQQKYICNSSTNFFQGQHNNHLKPPLRKAPRSVKKHALGRCQDRLESKDSLKKVKDSLKKVLGNSFNNHVLGRFHKIPSKSPSWEGPRILSKTRLSKVQISCKKHVLGWIGYALKI